MTDPSPARPGRTLLLALLFAALGCVLLRGTFVNLENLGAKDWNAFMGQCEAEITSILRNGQFPLWNPWRRGGQVSFAQPESMFLSPVTPLAFLVGTILAFKLLIVPVFVFGCFGLWKLAGSFGLTGAARLAPPLMFFSSAGIPYYVAGGLPNWLFGIAILPWLLYLRRRAAEHHGYVALGGLAYAFVLYCGSVYHFVFFPVIVGLDALIDSIRSRSWRPLLLSIAMIVVGAACALVRVLPMFDVYRVYPRELPASQRYLTFDLIVRALLDPKHPDLVNLAGTVLRDGSNWVSWVTVGSYVGPVFVCLSILGFVASPWRSLCASIVAIFLGWMSLGSGTAYSIWDLLHHLPLLRSMQAPERLLVPGLLVASIGAGYGVELLSKVMLRSDDFRGKPFLVNLLILLAATLPPVLCNDDIADAAFIEAPSIDLPAPGAFQQVTQSKRVTQWGGELYEAVRTNRGNPFAQADVPSPHAVRATHEPSYAGEVWLAKGRGTVLYDITPNRIEVHADVTDEDTLLVNQNYFPGWMVRGTLEQPMTARQGLLAVRLPKGKHDLELVFTQRSVLVGCVLSLVAMLLLVVSLGVRRSLGGPSNVLGVPEWIAMAGCGLLLFAVPITAITTPVQTVVKRGALIVDAEIRESGQFADIQAGIDAAVPGDVVLVRPGHYSGFTISSGITVMAEQIGETFVKSGDIEVKDIAAGYPAQIIGLTMEDAASSIFVRGCTGHVILQEVNLSASGSADGVALHLEQSGPVHVFRSNVGAVRVRGGFLLASGSRIQASPAGRALAALDVINSVALLHDTTVIGNGAPAVVAIKGRIEAQSKSADPFTRSGDGPILSLSKESWFRYSGFLMNEARVERGTDCVFERYSPELPSVAFATAPTEGTELEVELRGPPGGRGRLIISPVASLVEMPHTRQWVQANWETSGNLLVPIRLPESGTLNLKTDVKGVQLNVGWPIFMQFVLEVDASKDGGTARAVRASLLDGAIVQP